MFLSRGTEGGRKLSGCALYYCSERVAPLRRLTEHFIPWDAEFSLPAFISSQVRGGLLFDVFNKEPRHLRGGGNRVNPNPYVLTSDRCIRPPESSARATDVLLLTPAPSTAHPAAAKPLLRHNFSRGAQRHDAMSARASA